MHAVNSTGHPLKGAKLFMKQTKSDIPIGCAIANTILNNNVYQKWFLERFNVATFLNELKWYSTEAEQGQENYADADVMVRFCKKKNRSMWYWVPFPQAFHSSLSSNPGDESEDERKMPKM